MGCRSTVLFLCHGANFAALACGGTVLIGWHQIVLNFVLSDGDGGAGNAASVLLGAVLVAASFGSLISAVEALRLPAAGVPSRGGRTRHQEDVPLGILQPAFIWFAVLVASLYLQTTLSALGL